MSRPVTARAIAAAFVVVGVTVSRAVAHAGANGDPELLNQWRTQVHLLFQWAHLTAFGLWVGGMAAATRLPSLTLERTLFASWGLFFVSVATGGYNMEYSAAIPTAPDILALPALAGRYPFGDAYVILIGVKQALLLCAVALTLVVTGRHLRRPPDADRRRLRAVFVGSSVALGVLLAAVTSMVLVLHEAVDLAPTPLHSLGGVVLPRDEDETARARAATAIAPPPYGGDVERRAAGFELFRIPQAAADALARFGHLMGFALWAGAAAAGLGVPAGAARRVMPLVWLGLGLQLVTGPYQLFTWTPFALVPLPWRLDRMTRFRFGYTYTAVLAIKLALGGLGVLTTILLTRLSRPAVADRSPRALRVAQGAHVVIALGLGYVAMALLLVHEFVDHAL